MRPAEIFEQLITERPELGCIGEKIMAAYEMLLETYEKGGKLLLCGNGGSCADCQHIAGELMKGFLLKRPVSEKEAENLARYGEEGKHLARILQKGLDCVVLSDMQALSTAFANDVEADACYAQQAYTLAKENDVLLGISTSGNAKNVYYAAVAAKAKGARVIALTGAGGGKIAPIADVLINVPEKETWRVQEKHLPVYHALCAMLESAMFGGAENA